MKALVKEAAGPGLTLAEVPEPEPGPKEVLVRVIKAAVCGTDLHIYQWDEWARSVIEPPLVLGHEFVGEVVSLGPGATLHRAGDRVSGEGHITCGLCHNCRAGKWRPVDLVKGTTAHRSCRLPDRSLADRRSSRGGTLDRERAVGRRVPARGRR